MKWVLNKSKKQNKAYKNCNNNWVKFNKKMNNSSKNKWN